MKTIKASSYNVNFEKKSMSSLNSFLRPGKYSSVFILCDSNTLLHCLPSLVRSCPALVKAEIIEVEPGELSKDIRIAEMIWQTLLDRHADRKTLLVNLGGGVVSDLGGFSASVYMRGIDFVNVPTTLLAMADASVGGKTGIDFSEVKNLIGTFSQPSGVFICADFLKTLPARHFKNGLAEIYKIALVSDKKFWNRLETASVEEAIHSSVQLKNNIVKKDELDKGKRRVLNFGHTVGHALESIKLHSAAPLLHGEAVITGMFIETHLALQKKLISAKDCQSIFERIMNLFKLPDLSDLDTGELLKLMHKDKKARDNKIVCSLITGIGSCSPGEFVTEKQVAKALENYGKVNHASA